MPSSKGKTKKPPKRKVGRPPAGFSARDALLVGAGSAFSLKGYADANVEDICAAANVGRATFYRFFANKDEIFIALLERANTVLQEAVLEAVGKTKGVEKQLEAGIEAYLSSQYLSGNLARVLTTEVMTERFSAQRQAGIQIFVELFRTALRNFGLPQQDDFVLHGLVGSLEAISVEMLRHDEMDERLFERAKTAMLRIVKGTLLEKRPHPKGPRG